MNTNPKDCYHIQKAGTREGRTEEIDIWYQRESKRRKESETE